MHPDAALMLSQHGGIPGYPGENLQAGPRFLSYLAFESVFWIRIHLIPDPYRAF
jgi:hypothetical protein